jgi:GNAT superfamily N-acetyltransferase
VRRELAGGYELDDDRSRIDVDVVHRFLSEESYWARGRPREVVAASIDGSSRVLGLYRAGNQVGFTRACSDGAVFAVLCDVFVLAAHRGKGLGVELVREMVDSGSLSGLGWALDTDDAQGLYEKLGFAELVAPRTAMRRAARRG